MPTINFNLANEHIDFKNGPFYVNTELKDWQTDNNTPRVAAISAFGFSGTNCHLVVEEESAKVKQQRQQALEQSTKKPHYLIAISAKTERSLEQKIKDMQMWFKDKNNFIQHNSKTLLSNISYTLNAGRSHFNRRISMVVDSIEALENTLQAISEDKNKDNYFKGAVDNKKPDDAAIYKQVLKISLDKIKAPGFLHEAKEYKEILESLANLYVKGYDLDW